MKLTRVLTSAILLAAVACSSGDSGTEPTNQPPTITFTFADIGVPKSVPVDLTVSVADPDADALTITWQITRSSLAPQNAQHSVMRWTTPATLGTDTVVVKVSDGTVTKSVTAEIRVGTTFTNPIATNFTKANSPYIITMNAADPRVTVPGGVTRTIEAGTELLIDTEAGFFNVLGTLEANGTAGEPIIIRPNDRTLTCPAGAGWWEGIRAATDDVLVTDGFIDLEHVEIRLATNGVRLRDNASALVRDCRFVCSASAGVLIEGNGSLRAFDSEMSNGVQDGIAIAAIASLPDSVRITGCKLAINGNAGIRMDLQDTSNVTPIIVEFNEIEFNASHGISLAHSVFPSIHFNKFLGNGDETVSNLFLQGGYPGAAAVPVLNATCNFWGSAAASQATIDASIRDSLDAFPSVQTRVDSEPWLNLNPITTPPSCTP